MSDTGSYQGRRGRGVIKTQEMTHVFHVLRSKAFSESWGKAEPRQGGKKGIFDTCSLLVTLLRLSLKFRGLSNSIAEIKTARWLRESRRQVWARSNSYSGLCSFNMWLLISVVKAKNIFIFFIVLQVHFSTSQVGKCFNEGDNSETELYNLSLLLLIFGVMYSGPETIPICDALCRHKEK